MSLFFRQMWREADPPTVAGSVWGQVPGVKQGEDVAQHLLRTSLCPPLWECPLNPLGQVPRRGIRIRSKPA